MEETSQSKVFIWSSEIVALCLRKHQSQFLVVHQKVLLAGYFSPIFTCIYCSPNLYRRHLSDMQAAKSSLPGFKFSALDEFLNQCKCMSEMLLNTIPSVYIYVVYIYKQQQKKVSYFCLQYYAPCWITQTSHKLLKFFFQGLFYLYNIWNVLVPKPLGTCTNITSRAVCSAVFARLHFPWSLSSVTLTVIGVGE